MGITPQEINAFAGTIDWDSASISSVYRPAIGYLDTQYLIDVFSNGW
jgi:hypothetical protein